ncbi:hypothetical protein ACH5RR_011143 [Cinchona calisaya]|uniref:MARVEL domain-containing protein n=1 Tax=Cinchona calisaya TaxID=153742 RepID=A0ABD3A7N2_9GENT
MAYEFRPNPRESTELLPSMSYLLLASNSVGTIIRAYSTGRNWLLAFIFLIYSSFFLLEYCFSAYHRLPRNEKSGRKNFLAVAIWCLVTVIMFGFTYQFTPFFSFAAAAPLYAIAVAGSAIIFYVYIIYDGDEECSNRCSENASDRNVIFCGEQLEIIFEKI